MTKPRALTEEEQKLIDRYGFTRRQVMRKPSTDKQIRAMRRNWQIRCLRGVYDLLSSTEFPRQLDADYRNCINEALRIMGAETMSDRRARERKERYDRTT